MTTKVPVYGNYHGYYSKRPPAISDARLHHLPPDIFLNARVLDVGCNEGWITCEIAQNWGAQKVVGVDIDESLIEGAWRRRRALWSSQGPSSSSTSNNQEEESGNTLSGIALEPTGRKRSRSSDSDDDEPPSKSKSTKHGKSTSRPSRGNTKSSSNYFPASCEHEFGSLPIPPANPSNPSRGKNVFPHNVTFVKADWVDEDIVEDKIEGGWDVVVAFSISKWIHLNKADTGLLAFFHKVFRVLRTGGTFILEPQPWDSYAKAKRMSGRLKENARNLLLRPDNIAITSQREGDGGGGEEDDDGEEKRKLLSFEEVLVNEVGFTKVKRIEVQGEGGFARPLDLYVKS